MAQGPPRGFHQTDAFPSFRFRGVGIVRPCPLTQFPEPGFQGLEGPGRPNDPRQLPEENRWPLLPEQGREQGIAGQEHLGQGAGFGRQPVVPGGFGPRILPVFVARRIGAGHPLKGVARGPIAGEPGAVDGLGDQCLVQGDHLVPPLSEESRREQFTVLPQGPDLAVIGDGQSAETDKMAVASAHLVEPRRSGEPDEQPQVAPPMGIGCRQPFLEIRPAADLGPLR